MHRTAASDATATAEDASETLDAIAFDSSLSFLDDLDGVPKEIPVQFRTEPHVESEAQPIESVQSETAPVERPPPIPFRLRQKREIEYLRTQAAELEAELQRLKQVAVRDENAEQPSVWENIAKRQLGEKQRAEVENIKLRQQIESQLRVAQSLEKLLRKRTLGVMTHSFCPSTWLTIGEFLLLQSGEPESLFFERKRARANPEVEVGDLVSDIRENISVRFDEVDSIMAKCQLHAIAADFDEFRANFDENGGLCMEMVIVKVYPFHVESVAETVWQCTSGHGVKLGDGFYDASQHSDALCELEFSVNLSLRRTQTVITCRGFGARRWEPSRSEIVFETVGMTEVPLLVDEHIVYRERGYITIEETNTSANNPSTIVKACARITPEFERPAQQGRLSSAPKISWFMDLAIGSYEETAKALFQHIENTLMQPPTTAPTVDTPSTTSASEGED